MGYYTIQKYSHIIQVIGYPFPQMEKKLINHYYYQRILAFDQLNDFDGLLVLVDLDGNVA